MDKLNLNNIHSEFIEIMSYDNHSTYEIKEDLKKIEIEFDIPVDNKPLIKMLLELKHFEVLITNSSHSLKYYINNLTREIKETEIDYLRERKFRIRFDKEDINEKLKELNLIGLFFESTFLFNFLKNTNQHLNTRKLNIALFKTKCFNTSLLNLYSVNDLNFQKVPDEEIEDDVIIALNTLMNFTSIENSSFDNIFTYTPTGNNNLNIEEKFDSAIYTNFYIQFLKIFSHKCDTTSDCFNIRGKKSIIVTSNGFSESTNFKSFKSIIDFLLTGDKFLEKYIIIKDVITRYLENESDLQQLDNKINDIEKTIKHYFHKYVNDDIDEFFINRDSIYKEAISMSKSINEQNDKIISYINSTLISIIVLAITFAFKNFTKLEFNFILTTFTMLSIFSLYFHKTIKDNSIARANSVENQFDLFISRIGIIHVDEQNEIKKKFITDPREDLNAALSKIKFLLITINAILLILLIFTYFEPIIIHPTTK